MNIMTKRGNLDNVVTYEHFCDTFADLNNIPASEIFLGSTAVVIQGESGFTEFYIANSNKEWVPIVTSEGGGGLGVHICAEGEYDSSGVPTVEFPDENTFYFVPGGTSPNLYTEWIYANEAWEKVGDGSVVPVTDVQVNETSIVSNGVANIPVASANNLGVVKIDTTLGIGIDPSNNTLRINGASLSKIKSGDDMYRPITPIGQYASTFYGLAKAAGDSTQSASSNAVGTYTDSAKQAIQEMIGVENRTITVSGSAPEIVGVADTSYLCGEVTTISITPPAQGVIDVIFSSGSTPAVLTLPNTVRMPEWFEVEANHTYEINIANGVYGVVTSWAD